MQKTEYNQEQKFNTLECRISETREVRNVIQSTYDSQDSIHYNIYENQNNR